LLISYPKALSLPIASIVATVKYQVPAPSPVTVAVVADPPETKRLPEYEPLAVP
jgi:hypothetical protein